jgi:hypothetical protein
MIMMPNRTKVSQVVNSDSLITFFLILVLLVSFAGLLLTGCGGDSGPGLTEVDGSWQCEIPSPTGDQNVVVSPGKVAPARDRAEYIVIATNVETLCNNYKAWAIAQDKKNGVSNDTAMSGLDCSDVAHDFEGTSGYYWCVDLVQPSELATLKSSSYCKGLPSDEFSCFESVVENGSEYTPPLGSTCQGAGQSADVQLSSPACVAALIAPGAHVNNSMTRNWAICSQTGVFMGWMCGSGYN